MLKTVVLLHIYVETALKKKDKCLYCQFNEPATIKYFSKYFLFIFSILVRPNSVWSELGYY